MPTTSDAVEALWESHKSTILDLYFAEGMTLEEVMAQMKQNYSFDASKGQYESRFRKWNLRKNLKSSEWKYVSHRIKKRRKEGKESAVSFNRVPIAPEKVTKEISRHDVPTYCSAPTPQTPNDVSVYTPAPAAEAPSPNDPHAILESAPIASSSAFRIDETSPKLRNYFESLTTCFNLRAISDPLANDAQHLLEDEFRGSSHLSSKITLFETYNETYYRDFQVRVGILLGADLQIEGRLLELNGGQALLITATRNWLDGTTIVTQEAQVSATSNMPEAILPYVQLMLAAYHGNTPELLAVLGSKEVKRLIRTRLGAIALHIAVERSHAATITELVAAGVSIDARDRVGDTALHRATPWSANTRGRSEKILNILLTYGANPDTKDPLGVSELHSAAFAGHTQQVELLLRSGTDPSIRTIFGWAPLHWAASGGYLDCVKLLVEAGADVSAVSHMGETPLHLALAEDRTLVVEFLTRAELGKEHPFCGRD